MLYSLLLFLFGIIEWVLIVALTISSNSGNRKVACSITFLYILLWFLASKVVLFGSLYLLPVYALGCGVGTFLTCKNGDRPSVIDNFIKAIGRIKDGKK